MSVPYLSLSGIAYPDDLKLLKGVYDDICICEGIPCGSQMAEDLAMATMDLFSQGVFDEAEIRESLRLFLNRKTH